MRPSNLRRSGALAFGNGSENAAEAFVAFDDRGSNLVRRHWHQEVKAIESQYPSAQQLFSTVVAKYIPRVLSQAVGQLPRAFLTNSRPSDKATGTPGYLCQVFQWPLKRISNSGFAPGESSVWTDRNRNAFGSGESPGVRSTFDH